MPTFATPGNGRAAAESVRGPEDRWERRPKSMPGRGGGVAAGNLGNRRGYAKSSERVGVERARRRTLRIRVSRHCLVVSENDPKKKKVRYDHCVLSRSKRHFTAARWSNVKIYPKFRNFSFWINIFFQTKISFFFSLTAKSKIYNLEIPKIKNIFDQSSSPF